MNKKVLTKELKEEIENMKGCLDVLKKINKYTLKDEFVERMVNDFHTACRRNDIITASFCIGNIKGLIK